MKKRKTKWSKKTPEIEGWYWIKYKCGKTTSFCPAIVTHLKSGVIVTAWRNTYWVEGPNHGGKGLKRVSSGKLEVDKTLYFGPLIELPD